MNGGQAMAPAAPQIQAPPAMPQGGAFGFLDGSSYNQQGGQIQAPQMPAQQPVQAQPAPMAAPAPTAPPPIDWNARLSGLEKQFTQAQQMSPEEQAAQQQLINLQDSYRQGNQNIQDKVIPMEFIVGQQQSLENRFSNSQIPLQQRLALEQSKRTAAMDASKFALSRADEQYKQYGEEQKYQDQRRIAEEDRQRAYQSDARQFAFGNDIQTPFYNLGGTIYRTSDNKAYSTPEQFFADGGAKDFSNAKTVSQAPKPVTLNGGERLVDPKTGAVIASAPYKSSGGGGGTVSSPIIGGTGQTGNPQAVTVPLSSKDRTVFNQIVNQANKSPLIAAADRSVILQQAINQVKQNPNDAAQQLNLSYAYIQALDTYQSAVR
jgi:hypothetical protein